MKKVWLTILICLALTGMAAASVIWLQNRQGHEPKALTEVARFGMGDTPKLQSQAVVTGLDHPWDLAILPDSAIIYTERAAGISLFRGNQKRLLAKPADLYVRGEAGMMGLAIDPDFASNRFVYTCFATTNNDIRLVRWRLSANSSALEDRKDIVSGMPLNIHSFPGRHSGCRPRFSPDGVLWLGTGDVAVGTNPQDPKSLGGKVLRIDREGNPAAGNPGGKLDERIYSYGHRNVQGVAFRTENSQTVAFGVEHGPDRDDEVNVLKPANFGWDPIPGYNETVPMTDTSKFPDAVLAVWSSASSTIAPSGGTFLTGDSWGAWRGSLAMAVLKGEHLRILHFDSKNKLTGEVKVLDTFGRLRIAVQASDGSLYIATDNGENKDNILRIRPQ